MVTKGNMKKLYELSLLLTTLGLAALAVSEAETPNFWCLHNFISFCHTQEEC